MSSSFLLYGSNGFVGSAIAHLAVQNGLQPIIAGRDAAKIEAQAIQLGVEHRVFSLNDSTAMDEALKEVTVVLHCAGPYIHTFRWWMVVSERGHIIWILPARSQFMRPWQRLIRSPGHEELCSCPR